MIINVKLNSADELLVDLQGIRRLHYNLKVEYCCTVDNENWTTNKQFHVSMYDPNNAASTRNYFSYNMPLALSSMGANVLCDIACIKLYEGYMSLTGGQLRLAAIIVDKDALNSYIRITGLLEEL